MKGDFARVTFDSSRHFSQVLMQQGRVLLSDDLNEASDIFTYLLRTFIADAVGPYAGPAQHPGFAIGKAAKNLTVGGGHYWVDGILCQNNNDTTWPPNSDPNGPDLTLKGTLVYLDAWERHVSAVELDDIREKALGGPDTATRAQVVWQVGTVQAALNEALVPSNTEQVPAWWAEVDTVFQGLIPQWQPQERGRLRATLASTNVYKDACITPPQSGFRGSANYLYRIEVNQRGKANEGATFKWSRENGSVETGWTDTDKTDLLVDSSAAFHSGDWVELLDDDIESDGTPATLLQLIDVQPGRLTLASPPPDDLAHRANGDSQLRHPRVRRWDQKFTKAAQGNNGAVPILEPTTNSANWIDLENGIQIQFVPPDNTALTNVYRTGDYWLIPARVATAGLDLPGTTSGGVFTSDALKPRGVSHHYAPLAYFKSDGTLVDLRRLIEPSLTALGLPA